MSQHREKVEIGSLGEELYGGAGGISMDKAVRGGPTYSTLDTGNLCKLLSFMTTFHFDSKRHMGWSVFINCRICV